MLKISSIDGSFFNLKMVLNSVRYDSAVPLQLVPKMLSPNQNAEFFNDQYLWNESIDSLSFLHRVSH